ncbi:MAG TPA: BatA domain-containing protein [Gemmatimonadaceae bacterium]
MTFLAPWALLAGVAGAVGMVLLHLVSRQRPAEYALPTARFIPDQRSLVSRAAFKPRDLFLLALRVLLLLAAGAAFARPVFAPARGSVARIVLLDRSRAAGDMRDAVSRARAAIGNDANATIIAFDTTLKVVRESALDSLGAAPASQAPGSLSSALVAARRAGTLLAEHADSVRLTLVSPMAMSEIDSATNTLRTEWPGGVEIVRTALAQDTATSWRLSTALAASDPLAPAAALIPIGSSGRVTRLVRTSPSAADTAFARGGGTVVQWRAESTPRPTPHGLALGDEVIVAMLGRAAIRSEGAVIARWADGSAAARETRLGAGCLREIGVSLPLRGDLPLHTPFQRIARRLLTPCGVRTAEIAADSATVRSVLGASRASAPSVALRGEGDRASPMAKWLLFIALAAAVLELVVRARARQEVV